MSFRFRKTFTLFPGVRLNLSKGGLSISAGVPGATINFGPRGTALTVGVPGTGLSYRAQLTGGLGGEPVGGALPRQANSASWAPQSAPSLPDATPPFSPPLAGEIRSAEVAQLTTPDLAGLKRILGSAIAQRAELQREFASVVTERQTAWVVLRRAEQFPLSLFSKGRLPKLKLEFENRDAELNEIADAYQATEVRIDFAFDETALSAFSRLAEAHGRLGRTATVWDVTSSTRTNQFVQRTLAISQITRTLVRLLRTQTSIISSAWSALCFGNANGEDLELFPGICLVRQANGSDYALIDLRDLDLEFRTVPFQEDERIPVGVEIIGHTWLKTNRDGSPDRRFKENRQIPIVMYARLDFSTAKGISEAYMVSDVAAAAAFAEAFRDLRAELRRLAARDGDGEGGGSASGQSIHDTKPVGARLKIPELPTVPPAHGYTALGAAMLGAAIATGVYLATQSEHPQTSGTTPAVAETAPASTSRSQPLTSEAVRSPPAAQSVPVAAPAAPGGSAAALERVRIRQAANIRGQPNGGAEILRVAPAGIVLNVYGRSGAWVQVGDTSGMGWIHNSLLTVEP